MNPQVTRGPLHLICGFVEYQRPGGFGAASTQTEAGKVEQRRLRRDLALVVQSLAVENGLNALLDPRVSGLRLLG